MRKPLLKNSKGGFSLPAAMAITATLIILSASLIYIAMSSISTTSMDTSGRQAYLNVRSALEYAENYYSGVKDYTDFGTQYMVMKDKGGTTSEGAEISKTESSINNSTTYVIAQFIEMPDTQPNKLKLTAYSKYGDSFGKRQKLAQLSVTFSISRNGGNYRRITVISTPASGPGTPTGKEINVNVKQAPDQNWTMAYYVWTYKDQSGIYTGKDLCEDINGTPPSVDNVNTNETIANQRFPSGNWINETAAGGDEDKIGPPAIAGTSGDGWNTGLFTPEDTVNYFNIILAKKGAVLSAGDDTQTCEMFHLWYLNKNDRNVYFEFLKKDIYYYKNSNWNGQTNLDGVVIAYVKNPVTTVHFKSKGLVDDDAVTTTAAKPVIKSVSVDGSPISGKDYFTGGTVNGSSPITMTYEGCGWWVATVKTSSVFTMEIDYSDGSATYSKTVRVTPSSNDDAWVIADGETLQSRLTESNANIALGIVNGSYVTVHAKAYNTDTSSTPKLNYSFDKDNYLSLSAREELLAKINEAQNIDSIAYTSDSYTKLTDALDVAVGHYNVEEDSSGVNKIRDIINDGSMSRSTKIRELTKIYQKDVQDINNAIDGLVEAIMTPTTIKKLEQRIKEYEAIVADQEAYDGDENMTYYDYSVYSTKKLNIDSHNYLVDAKAAISGLSATENQGVAYLQIFTDTIDAITAKKINKAELTAAIDSAGDLVFSNKEGKTLNTTYTPESAQAVKDAIIAAENEYKSTTATTASHQTALGNLAYAVSGLVNTTYNTATLTALITKAGTLIDSASVAGASAYTDTGLTKLKEARDSANSVLSSATSQEQIDAESSKLALAIKYFNTPKPLEAADKYASEKKVKIYLDVPNTLERDYTLNQYIKEGTDDDVIKTPGLGLSYDANLGLSYVIVDRDIYDKVSVTYEFIKDGVSTFVETTRVDLSSYTSGELVLNLKFDNENQKITLSFDDVITLYMESGNYSSVSAQPIISCKNSSGEVVSTQNAVSEGSGNYYVVKFLKSQVEGQSFNLVAGDTSLSNIGFSAFGSGQYVIKYISETSAHYIPVADIYPKYSVTTGSGTSSAANNASASLLSTKLANSFTSSDSNNSTSSSATVSEVFDISPAEGNTIIIVYAGSYTNIKGWIWPKGGTGTSPGFGNAAWPGNALLRYKSSNYYYTEVPNTVYGVILSSNGTKISKNKGTYTNPDDAANIIVNNDSETVHYRYIVVNDALDGVSLSNTAPNVEVEDTSGGGGGGGGGGGSIDASTVDMVFAGGNKVRFKNRSYYLDYPSGKKDDAGNYIGSGNLFGGNNKGMNRVGNTTASAMYDWYEFKIPVDSTNEYNFSITGINRSDSSKQTKEVLKAYGDVWISLDSASISGGRYADCNLTTFDPEVNAVGEKVRIYVRNPSNTDTTWYDFKYTNYGISGGTTASFTSDTTAEYLYAEVNSKAPFIIISADVKDNATGVVTHRTYKTSLQGDNYVLFDPSYNSNAGGWDSYVSPQELLKNEVLKAQTLYYGATVVGKYDDSGKADSSTYNYVEKLKDLYKPYTNQMRVDHKDWTINVSSISSLSISQATDGYNNIHPYVQGYTNLNTAMSEARAYIKDPLNEGIHAGNTGYYPEYLSSGNKSLTFEPATINSLRTKLKNAESTYLNTSVTPAQLNTAVSSLKTAIASVTVKNSGTIAVVFYDTTNVVSTGANITIDYKDTSGNSYTERIKDKNLEGYPIIFIKSATDIKDAVIKVNSVPRTSLNEVTMKIGEAWVFMDYFDEDGNSEGNWQLNSMLDYRQINADEFTQYEDTDAAEYVMQEYTKSDGTTAKRTLVLYFQYDTSVQTKSNGTYQIKSGAYTFEKPDEAPLSGGRIDLYSAAAKAYFTNSDNYGWISGGTTSEDLGWTSSDGALKSGTSHLTTTDVNMVCTDNTLSARRSYSTSESMYFRFEGNGSFNLKNTLILAANNITFATSKIIDGTSTYGRSHLYITKPGYDKALKNSAMKLTFKSDVHVMYYDTKGAYHDFYIREGTYVIESKETEQTYVADLMDEDYWKDMKPVDGSVSTTGGTQTVLLVDAYE